MAKKEKAKPVGVSAWLHQVLTQMQDALRGPTGPQGPIGRGG